MMSMAEERLLPAGTRIKSIFSSRCSVHAQFKLSWANTFHIKLYVLWPTVTHRQRVTSIAWTLSNGSQEMGIFPKCREAIYLPFLIPRWNSVQMIAIQIYDQTI